MFNILIIYHTISSKDTLPNVIDALPLYHPWAPSTNIDEL